MLNIWLIPTIYQQTLYRSSPFWFRSWLTVLSIANSSSYASRNSGAVSGLPWQLLGAWALFDTRFGAGVPLSGVKNPRFGWQWLLVHLMMRWHAESQEKGPARPDIRHISGIEISRNFCQGILHMEDGKGFTGMKLWFKRPLYAHHL